MLLNANNRGNQVINQAKYSLLVAALTLAGTAHADSVKIGFVSTLTTPAGVIGADIQNSVDLALDFGDSDDGAVPIAPRRIDRPPIVAARARSVARARHSTRPREIPTQPSSARSGASKKSARRKPGLVDHCRGTF